jgi:hypothetical protein
MVIANGGDHTRWYDADGAILDQRGGEAGGPGEFLQAGAEQCAEAEHSAAQMELPESAPAYAEPLVDDDTNLWVGLPP